MIDKNVMKEKICFRLKRHFGKELSEASEHDIYDAVSSTIMDYILDHWMDTRKAYERKAIKQAYYLSAEFLMGRAMGNNLVNMSMVNEVRDVLHDLGLDLNAVEDKEPDAGLGNGGLGRLAACFLDSLATLDLPGHGYGIRYKYGMFAQKIEKGYQVEYPDKWLDRRDPWSVKRVDDEVQVKFGGHVIVEREEDGRENFKRVDAEVIRAVPYDMPIVGYDTKTVNTLRLWEAEAVDGFDLQLFNDMQYTRAVEKSNMAEDISRVLYPNDSGPSGKALRLKQQYFFVSASLQDIVRSFKRSHKENFKEFPKYVAIQLNDTHPVVAIPELMRILMDWEKLGWEDAWAICTQTFAYTNHTILAEALEKWPIEMFNNLLPRIYQIVEEINRRFLDKLRFKYPQDYGKHHRMSIVADGMVKMAWLAIVGSHSVNGVAALHTQILKSKELKDWYEMYPEKFNNKTNGITQRRWLLKANPELATFLDKYVGISWKKDLAVIRSLNKYADDENVLNELMDIKHHKKAILAQHIKNKYNINIDPNSIFDIQIKRLHEYKRQLLNVLHIMYLYNKILDNPDFDLYPRTFIFGAKAASGYRRAKQIIKLINTVAYKINNDERVQGKIKVVFIENYRVSIAEKLFPAADVSEQISTAGKEASGTGNMKFMANGALTIGTLDGANIEILQEAGKDNAFIFGMTADQVHKIQDAGNYNPWDFCRKNTSLGKVISQLVDGMYNEGHREIFREIYDSLMYGIEGNAPDVYYILADFESYVKAQEQIDKSYRDKMKWARMSLANIAGCGKFSSDRTIKEYAKEIWDIAPVSVE
ncbi:glycogen/starch/alpha-glucan phosphorylase [Spirochaeta cellobiosiphila]|uniref:glycogen/starch/alpha-glucan phosphorylase n=1 Tax=Spirochaeta cellobiosiphila TaxID=504483 RepID=UPI000406BAF7|nr:glycogen/starch/alpha-glucan phosphorylase [Spirochaeta cellobiosiphila]